MQWYVRIGNLQKKRESEQDDKWWFPFVRRVEKYMRIREKYTKDIAGDILSFFRQYLYLLLLYDHVIYVFNK